MCRAAHFRPFVGGAHLRTHAKSIPGILQYQKQPSRHLQFRLHAEARDDNDVPGRQAKLVFDLPRPFTRAEKFEVRDELVEALASLPPLSKPVLSNPDELRLREKIELICARINDNGLENVLKLLREALAAHGDPPSTELRQILVGNNSLTLVLRETFAKRKTISPVAVYAGTQMSLWLVGPGTEQPATLASAFLEELGFYMQCLPASDMGEILSAAARRDPPLPGAIHLLETLLLQLHEKAPAELSEDELIIALTALGYVGSHHIDPLIIEDFLNDLHDYWPLCTASTLLFVLLRLGQASVLDASTFREIVKQLGARQQYLSSADRESLLLMLTLHKSAFDRARVIPHPLHDDSTKLLIKELALDVSNRISTAPIESLVRPLVSLAELLALNKKIQKALNEKLSTARLFSLPPSAFASLVYAHRLANGPVPRDELRQPFGLAFGALLHGMEPQQIASCIQSLWQYSTKKTNHVFASAYGVIARTLEAGEVLTPADVASTIQIYPRLRFEEVSILVRMLRAVAPERLQETPFVQLTAPQTSGDQGSKPVARGMLAWMSMGQLVDVLEAFGEQGLGCSGTVAHAVLCRYEANGGRISRRNTARALRALANLGEQPIGVTQMLLTEIRAWMEQDPEAKCMSQRPALIALWSLCALDILAQAETEIDWLLNFLCRNDQIARVLSVKLKSCLLFESLCVVRHGLPGVGMKYLGELETAPGLVDGEASRELIGISTALQSPSELLSLEEDRVGTPISLESILDTTPDEIALSGTDSNLLPASDTDDHLTPWPDLPPELNARTALYDLSLRWHLETRATHDSVSKVKLIIGEVLSVLNIGQVLRRALHPQGALAAEATRLTGGFELRWQVGPYDVDWAHPHLRIGILVIEQKDFVEGIEEAALLARTRLRVRHLMRAQGWRLIIIRAAIVRAALQPLGEDPILSNHPAIQGRVRHANAAFPMETRKMIKRIQREGNLDEMAERLSQQLEEQLEIVFPDSVTSLGTQDVRY